MTYTNVRRRAFEFAIVLFAVVVPLSVHAGVFASLLGSSGGDAMIEQSGFVLETNAQTVPLLKAATHIDPHAAIGGGDVVVDFGALVPGGGLEDEDTINTRTANGEISVYVVREGDTLSQIAEMFSVSAKTILWANDIKDASLIRPSDKLVILPITGVRHVVKSGDTIAAIAKKYEGEVDDILAYNMIDSIDSINIGDTIVIPGGEMAAPARTYATPVRSSGSSAVATGGGSSGYIHPLPGSIKSQGIHGYNGVDFAAPAGTPIRAAAAGEVILSRGSGWNGGYGVYVVIKHPNGTQTLYAHNSRNAVATGEYVSAGDIIGYVGNTGRSTGNHLHFEVRGARNPF